MSTPSTLQTLHVSIGPARSFVERSSRTRDLRAGSFLLSYLVGESIAAVLELPGIETEMVFPRLSDNDMMAAIRNASPDAFTRGTVPRHFVLRTDAPEDAATLAETSFREAWGALAGTVWSNVVAPAADKGNDRADEPGPRAIWNRQIEECWHVDWAIGESPRVSDERRERVAAQPDGEPGDRCTMMPRWRELSGWDRSRSSDEAERQDDFWATLRERSDHVHESDLEEGERLCAPALIKRLYPRLSGSEELVEWPRDVDQRPSTARLAAAPWVARVIEAAPEEAGAYARDVRQARGGAFTETETSLSAVTEAVEASDSTALEGFQHLDGHLYVDDALEDPEVTELDWEEARRTLIERLRGLYDTVEEEPSRFYAVLLMNGDETERMLSRATDDASGEPGEIVAGAIDDFARRVDDVVGDRGGETVRAAGDDVLALLPQPHALACAAELREHYLDVFDRRAETLDDRTLREAIGREPTLSGAIVYAHHQTTLDGVLEEGRAMLDDVARGRHGGDSLAIGVLGSGGKQCEWSMPWEEALVDADADAPSGPTIIDDLVERYRDGAYTGDFIRRLRDLFALLADPPRWRPGAFVEVPEALPPKKLWLSEYVAATDVEMPCKEVEARIERLLEASWAYTRSDGADRSRLGFDAPLLIRFLARRRAANRGANSR